MEIEKELLKRLSKLELLGIIEYEVYSSTRDINTYCESERSYKIGIVYNGKDGDLDLSRLCGVTDLKIVFNGESYKSKLQLPKDLKNLEINAYNITFETIEGLENVRVLSGEVNSCKFERDISLKDIDLEEGMFKSCYFKGNLEISDACEYRYVEDLYYTREERVVKLYNSYKSERSFYNCYAEGDIHLKGDNWLSGVDISCNRLYIDERITRRAGTIFAGREGMTIVGNKEGKLYIGEDNRKDGYTVIINDDGFRKNNSNYKGIRHLVICGNTEVPHYWALQVERSRDDLCHFYSAYDLEILEIRADNFEDTIRLPNMNGVFARYKNLKKVIFNYVGSIYLELEEFADIVLYKHLGRGKIKGITGDIHNLLKAAYGNLVGSKEEITIEIECNGERKVMEHGYVRKFFGYFDCTDTWSWLANLEKYRKKVEKSVQLRIENNKQAEFNSTQIKR